MALLMALLVSACAEKEETRRIDILRMAVLPDHDKEEIQRTHQELLDHITSRTGLKTQLVIPDSYEDLLRLFDDKAVDLALFGGVTYVKAHLKNGAVPLVMRDVDGHFRSVALVHADNPAKDITDLRGASLAFSSELSTSGHLMPRYFLEKMNIIPEEFFKTIQYTGAHDLTAEWVRDGIVEVGIANSGIVNNMFLSGQLNNQMIKIIWQSPPFSDYIWALQPDISKQLTIKIRDSFLLLNQEENNKALMKKLGANYYIPVTHDNFKDLEQVIRHMEQQKDTP